MEKTTETEKVPYKNHEGYPDPTPHEALNQIMQQPRIRDEADHRHWRLVRTLQNVMDLMDYDLLNRIEVRDRRSGRIYR